MFRSTACMGSVYDSHLLVYIKLLVNPRQIRRRMVTLSWFRTPINRFVWLSAKAIICSLQLAVVRKQFRSPLQPKWFCHQRLRNIYSVSEKKYIFNDNLNMNGPITIFLVHFLFSF